MMRMFLFSQYQKWHEILAKKTRIYGIAMQSCYAFWNYSAAFIFSQHPHKTITNLRTAEWGKLRPTLRYPAEQQVCSAGPALRPCGPSMAWWASRRGPLKLIVL